MKTFVITGMDDLGSEKSPCSSIGGSGSGVVSLKEGSDPGGLKGGHQQRRSRAGRVRTVLTEKQLSLLKNWYNANPRPDALVKEQLCEMTGLSSRVIRVWFQNKRCKDKKRMVMHKTKVLSCIICIHVYAILFSGNGRRPTSFLLTFLWMSTSKDER